MSRKAERQAKDAHQAAPPQELRERLGIDIDLEALSHALTHRSYAHENPGLADNERLEFLGDAVLEYVVTGHLYRRYPDTSEGDLVRLRAAIVSTKALANVARKIGLGTYILLGHGELMSNGRQKDSILADTMEAIFGVVYIQAGIEAAENLITEHVVALLDDSEAMLNAYDWKTLIQEYVHANQHQHHEYQIVGEGPDHNRVFTATLYIDGKPYGQGTATSKRESEKRAAHESWKQLQPGVTPPHA
ncbi:ribonuclease III [Micrococcoides hystricis]|uniref:Ribonuclease 3 n=1 Tax=Micrococcoides hystricis TaxID=1572761 RepID=A0ABV6PC35_9MICC